MGEPSILAEAEVGHHETVKMMLSHGANLESEDANGNTLLMLAGPFAFPPSSVCTSSYLMRVVLAVACAHFASWHFLLFSLFTIVRPLFP